MVDFRHPLIRDTASCLWTTTPMSLQDEEEGNSIRRVQAKHRSLRGSIPKKQRNPTGSQRICCDWISNRLREHSASDSIYQSADMGTSVAVCLVFIGCCSNVVFLELLVRSVIDSKFSPQFKHSNIWPRADINVNAQQYVPMRHDLDCK